MSIAETYKQSEQEWDSHGRNSFTHLDLTNTFCLINVLVKQLST